MFCTIELPNGGVSNGGASEQRTLPSCDGDGAELSLARLVMLFRHCTFFGPFGPFGADGANSRSFPKENCRCCCESIMSAEFGESESTI